MQFLHLALMPDARRLFFEKQEMGFDCSHLKQWECPSRIWLDFTRVCPAFVDALPLSTIGRFAAGAWGRPSVDLRLLIESAMSDTIKIDI